MRCSRWQLQLGTCDELWKHAQQHWNSKCKRPWGSRQTWQPMPLLKVRAPPILASYSSFLAAAAVLVAMLAISLLLR